MSDWWKAMAGNNFVAYINIDADWSGAPDQGLLEKKGGRGYPFCVIMAANGEVLWEAAPLGKDDLLAALAMAQRLADRKARLLARPDDAALAAEVALLTAMGCDQRPAPSAAELARHAKVDGVDRRTLADFRAWEKERRLLAALRDPRECYRLLKAGEAPPEDSVYRLPFMISAAFGAIEAGDKLRASQAEQALHKALPAAYRRNPELQDSERFQGMLKGLAARIAELPDAGPGSGKGDKKNADKKTQDKKDQGEKDHDNDNEKGKNR